MATFAVSGAFTGTGSLAGTVAKAAGISGSFTGTGTLTLDTDDIVYARAIAGSIGSATLGLSLDETLFTIERSRVWWNTNWLYRRNLGVQANTEGIEADHPITCYITRDIIVKNKANADLSDFEVLRLVSFVPETWVRVPFVAEYVDNTIKFQWNNQIDIAPNTRLLDTYFIYYGNHDLVGDEDTLPYTPPEWPVSLGYNSPRLQLTRPAEDWENEDGVVVGKQDQAKMTILVDGDQVQIRANKGPRWGIAEAQVDDGEWVEVDLYEPVEEEDAIAYTVTGLSLGEHTVRYRRSGRRAPMAETNDVNFTHVEYRKNAKAINIEEEANETLLWGSVIGGVIGG